VTGKRHARATVVACNHRAPWVVDHVAGEASSTLELSPSEDRLRIPVADGSALRPVVRQFEVGAPRGHGMRLVESIADRRAFVGHQREDHPDGKAVRFQLAAPQP
jgi:hypothetical protein